MTHKGQALVLAGRSLCVWLAAAGSCRSECHPEYVESSRTSALALLERADREFDPSERCFALYQAFVATDEMIKSSAECEDRKDKLTLATEIQDKVRPKYLAGRC